MDTPPASRQRALAVAVVLVLVAVFGPGFFEYATLAARPDVFADDARQQIWPLLCYSGRTQFCGDYIARFYLDAFPVGFHGLYYAAAQVADPRALSAVLPLVLFALTLGIVVAAVQRTEGWLVAAASAVLLLICDDYVSRMAGGLPRAFTFPTMALALGGLLVGRPSWVVGATIAGALTYFAMGLLSGLLLTALLAYQLVAEPRPGAVRRSIILLVATGAVAILSLLPPMISSRPYGPLTTPSVLAQFPELGPGGRYAWEDSIDNRTFADDALTTASRSLANTARPFLPADWPLARQAARATRLLLLAVLVAGTAAAARRRPHVRRLLLAVPIVVGMYYLSAAVWPQLWLPQRYVGYTIPLFIAFLTPIAIRALIELCPAAWGLRTRAAALVLAATALAGLVVGGSGPGGSGLSTRLSHEQLEVMRFVRGLPAAAVIAGWPGNTEIIDTVPLAGERPALVTFEAHQVYHQSYALTLRRRMMALIDAYATGERPALVRLRDEFGVSHLIVDTRHFDRPLEYFEPFAARLRAMGSPAAPRAAFERWTGPAAVFNSRRYIVLDLSRLPE